jgi:putative aldouronate transport system permease protein
MEVLDTFAYRKGLSAGDFSFATAVSIFKTFVSLILIFTTNRIAKIVQGKAII